MNKPRQRVAAGATHFTFPCFANGRQVETYDGRVTEEDKVVVTKRP
jgi:hypothetical protein